MNPTIRGYLDADFLAVSALERENSPRDCKPEVFIRQAGALFADTFFATECDGLVVGYAIGALVQHRPATGWVLRLVVAERYRRRGFGESLVAAVVAGLGELGAEEVYLSVAPSNRAARAIYERQGFSEVDLRPAYFGEGGDRCILKKKPCPCRKDLIRPDIDPYTTCPSIPCA